MARASSLLLLVIYHLSLLSFAEEVTGFNPRCPPLPCGNLGFLSFPFSNGTNPECGLLKVENCSEPFRQKIQLGKDGPWFYIKEINQDNSLILRDQVYPDRFKNHICRSFQNFTLSSSPLYSFEFLFQLAMFNCSNYSNLTGFELLCNESNHSIILYNHTTHPSPPAGCSVIQPQLTKTQKSVFLHNIYNGGFFLQVNVTKECLNCYSKRGQCLSNSNGKFQCSGSKTGIKVTVG